MRITRQVKITVGAAVAAVAIVLLAKVIFNLPFERAALLAPLFVLTAGVLVGTVIFWVRVALQQWRGDDGRQHPEP